MLPSKLCKGRTCDLVGLPEEFQMRTVPQGLAVAYCYLKQLRPFIMAESRLVEEAEAKLESSTLIISDHKMKWPEGAVHPIAAACSEYLRALGSLGLFPSFNGDVGFFPSMLCFDI